MNIEIGDTVMLRSGGQPMTIQAIRDDKYIEVVWMVGGQIDRDAFHFSELVKLIVVDITL